MPLKEIWLSIIFTPVTMTSTLNKTLKSRTAARRWRAVRMKKGGESVTNEQRNKTRLALYRYGMRLRARNPVEHSWCAAIEESLTYYRQHDPLRADLFELRYVQHRTEDDVMDRLHIGRTTYKKAQQDLLSTVAVYAAERGVFYRETDS